jgi:cytochrome c oxidase subunit IV
MEHAQEHAPERTHKKPNYMIIFFALAVLTAIEVWVAGWQLGDTTLILILVGLAVWKAALVAMYYMHLRFEPPRLVLMVLAPLPLAFLLVLAVLTEF